MMLSGYEDGFNYNIELRKDDVIISCIKVSSRLDGDNLIIDIERCDHYN